MELIAYSDRDMMMIDLANVLAGEIGNCLLAHEAASLAVPGGTTPGPIFDALCAADLEWERVTVLLTDERWVPESSPRSNTALVRRRLLVERAAAARLLPFYTGAETPELGLEAATGALAAALPISVLLLGMGADMHTASLFPGAENLDAALAPDAPPLMAVRAAAAPEPRITLTAPALRAAMSIHLVITGSEKRAALEAARRGGDPLQAPVLTVLDQATVHWAE